MFFSTGIIFTPAKTEIVEECSQFLTYALFDRAIKSKTTSQTVSLVNVFLFFTNYAGSGAATDGRTQRGTLADSERPGLPW